MNQEIKQKWVEALRSGEYQQGQCALKQDNNFCCLGVLCDIHSKETGGAWVSEGVIKSLYLGEKNFLPIPVMTWAGLPTKKGAEVQYNNGCDGDHLRMLTILNDDTELSFTQIADIIEAQL